jgi:hypothetical protein
MWPAEGLLRLHQITHRHERFPVYHSVPISRTSNNWKHVRCEYIVELTRFRGRLTRPNFGTEVAHEIQQESRTTGAARLQP